MHPDIGRGLPLFGQSDHVYRRCVATFPARPAFERGLELPDRRVLWPADTIQRDARFGFAAMAAYLQPAEPAVEALSDRGGRLRWSTVAFHADRPQLGLRSIRLPYGLPGVFSGAVSADLGAYQLATEDRVAGFGTLDSHDPALIPERSLHAAPATKTAARYRAILGGARYLETRLAVRGGRSDDGEPVA
jgi:hypothetical protein